jgi:phosphoadenosine phosphosulfate reductase
MALVEHTLFEIIDKVEMALARIKDFEPPEGYYLAFSGGKDSCVIKHLADRAGVKYDAYYNVTNLDPPELVRFIKKQHPDVHWNLPKKSFRRMLLEKKFPPLRHRRWCCELLKENSGAGRTIMMGVRWAEGANRKKRRMYEICRRDSTKKYLSPIIDWENDDVWEYIKANNISSCSLYDEGFERLGCVMCPFASTRNRMAEAKRFPKYAARYKRWFRDLMVYRILLGKPLTNFKDEHDLYNWWMQHDGHRKTDENQCVMIFE